MIIAYARVGPMRWQQADDIVASNVVLATGSQHQRCDLPKTRLAVTNVFAIGPVTFYEAVPDPGETAALAATTRSIADADLRAAPAPCLAPYH